LTDPERDFELVADRIDGLAEEMVELQRDLVAQPAVGPDNGGPGEAAKAAVYQAWVERLGLEILHVDGPDARVEGGLRPNILAFLPGREERRVWILAHLDIVPPGQPKLWSRDPYTLYRDGNKLFGRGTEDNHHGLVSAYFAAKAVLQAGIEPGLSLGLIAVSDEETGSAYGLEYVLKQRGDLFRAEDLILVPDAGRPDATMIEVAEKSMLWVKFTVKGKQVHGSRPETGRNTLAGAAHMIVALEELEKIYPAEDPLFLPPRSTFPPTRKEANVPNINTIPGEDVFYLDCRVLPQYDLEEVLETARRIAAGVAEKRGLQLEVEAVQLAQAAPATPVDAPVVQALQRGVARVYQRQAKPAGIGGGTVAAFFRRAGLPAAVWQAAPKTAHMPDEYCFLSDLVADAKVMAHLLLFG